MADTASGGVYLAADGETYVDAFGKPVKGDAVAEAKRIQREQSDRNMATLTPIPSQSNEALAAAMRTLLIPQGQPQRATFDAPAPVPDTDTGSLVAETERRARNRS